MPARVLIPLPILLISVLIAASLGAYGIGLFVVLPFAAGLLLDLALRPRSEGNSAMQAVGLILAGSIGLLAVAAEGLICLVMAIPLALPAAIGGAWFGYWLRHRTLSAGQLRGIVAAAVLLGPTAIGAESIWKPRDPLFRVESVIEVNASPEVVWRHVVSFAELPEERDWLFHIGLAYPKRATIEGTGVGAIRRCRFSTGDFVEPVTVWDEPRRLAFSVTASAPPMQEWSPYRDLHPPHLDGYLVSRQGEFRLTPLDGGRRTRLTGRTWYQHHMQPAQYWRWWSDLVIHRIHLRVLRHVKTLAERG